MSPYKLEQDLAALLAGSAPEIPAAAEAIAAEHLVDLIGVALAAVDEPAFQSLLRVYPAAGGGDRCARVWGTGINLARRDAALVNGFAGHFHDFDDDETELAMAHVTVTALTAALTTADSKPVTSGQQVLRAYILGVEAATRLGRLINPFHYKSGWHASATLGVFAAAAASGHILRLTPSAMRHSLGMAASFASGLRSNFGSDTKPLQVGHAVAQGILASELAAEGLTSTPGSLLGPKGYVSFFGGAADASAVVAGFGAPFDLIGSGLTIKAFPCCTASHTAVDALLFLRAEQRFEAAEIERIVCWIDPAVPTILVHDRPTTGLEAKFSLPFCLAAAAVFGGLKISEFTDETAVHPDVRAIMDRIVVRTDPGLPKGDSGISVSSRLSLTLQDGSCLERFEEFVPGGPSRRLDRARLFEKFEACAGPVLGSGEVRAAFDALLNVKGVDECHTLLDLICMPAERPSNVSETNNKRKVSAK
jgi:2-methylcitrate dehydratase PrpD